MQCIKCGRQAPEKGDLFCCAACQIAIEAKLPASLSIADFKKHESGEIVGEENMEFLGRVFRAGLVEHLNSHYKTLTEDLKRCNIMRGDGTIDIERYRRMRKTYAE
jgi:hypothetical protein